MSNRKTRNLGGTFEETIEPYFDGPELAQNRTNIAMPERMVLAVLRSEVERLRADRAELTRFFSHFFDPTAPQDRDAFVSNFISEPPNVVLGYPRTTAEMPCISVVLEAETEVADGGGQYLADYLGETLEDENTSFAAEYVGALFESTYSVFIYAQHPDVCVYLYQFVKTCLFGAREAFTAGGLIDPSFSGGELAPQEMYLPENMFARVVRMTARHLVSVPKVYSFVDGRNLRVVGVHQKDIVVDGFRGRVGVYEETNDGEEP